MASIITDRAPRRKALIIGVNYAGNREWPELRGQQDATRFKQFLIDRRAWTLEDIVLMLDEPGLRPHLRPTQNNIKMQMRRLVEGAVAGDHFIFYFAGHTWQVKNGSNSEEDGMDEALIPCDCSEDLNKPIIDNELKRTLVDPLPVGSTLVAIFDSCHSGTLLDLDHYKCNAVYVPWISKGQRKTETPRNSIVRRLACMGAAASRRVQLASLGPRISLDGPPARRARPPSRSLTAALCPPEGPEFVLCPPESAASLFWASEPGTQSPVRRCLSPEGIYPCEGHCAFVDPGDRARVVALSACADSESAWEGEGRSMTISLLALLSDHPEITYHELLVRLSHQLHHTARSLHEWSRACKREKRERKRVVPRQVSTDSAGAEPVYEMDNFQSPQLSSHYRLNMDDMFPL